MGRIKSAKHARKMVKLSQNAKTIAELLREGAILNTPKTEEEKIYRDLVLTTEEKIELLFPKMLLELPKQFPSEVVQKTQELAHRIYMDMLAKFSTSLYSHPHSTNQAIHESNIHFIKELLRLYDVKGVLESLLSESDENLVDAELMEFKLRVSHTLEKLAQFHTHFRGMMIIEIEQADDKQK